MCGTVFQYSIDGWKKQTKRPPKPRPDRRFAKSLLILLFFQLLFLGDVGLHLGLGPAVQIGLALPGDAQRLRGHVFGDGAAGGRVGSVADLDRSHQIGVAADEAVIADGGAELILAVVVAGDGAAAEVAVLAHIAVADVGQVADRVAPGKVGILGLHIGTQMDAVIGDGVDPHMGERPDVVVGAQMTAVHLAGVDGGALVYGAVLNEAVGADDAARADDGFAPQDGAGQDLCPGGDDDALVDFHGTALDHNAVCNVAQQHFFTLCLGSIQPRAGGGKIGIHKNTSSGMPN